MSVISKIPQAAAAALGISLLCLAPAQAEKFKSVSECVAGTRVKDMLGKSGTVVGPNRGSPTTMCDVRMDDGKTASLIFWMLNAEAGSAETNDRLVAGIYNCFGGDGRYTFMDMRITGANTYVSADKSGRFHVEPSRNIVFESGPLRPYRAHLLAGPAIGIDATGSGFYGTRCELKK